MISLLLISAYYKEDGPHMPIMLSDKSNDSSIIVFDSRETRNARAAYSLSADCPDGAEQRSILPSISAKMMHILQRDIVETVTYVIKRSNFLTSIISSASVTVAVAVAAPSDASSSSMVSFWLSAMIPAVSSLLLFAVLTALVYHFTVNTLIGSGCSSLSAALLAVLVISTAYCAILLRMSKVYFESVHRQAVVSLLSEIKDMLEKCCSRSLGILEIQGCARGATSNPLIKDDITNIELEAATDRSHFKSVNLYA
jgi:hypothetical protein